MAFGGEFRRYQRAALDAFEAARATPRRRLYLVMPPGSGKTVAGLETARRLEQPTLVLAPNTAVQSQWLLQWRDFIPGAVRGTADRSLPRRSRS
jgi:superfamily II DNA or RNA helicase